MNKLYSPCPNAQRLPGGDELDKTEECRSAGNRPTADSLDLDLSSLRAEVELAGPQELINRTTNRGEAKQDLPRQNWRGPSSLTRD